MVIVHKALTRPLKIDHDGVRAARDVQRTDTRGM